MRNSYRDQDAVAQVLGVAEDAGVHDGLEERLRSVPSQLHIFTHVLLSKDNPVNLANESGHLVGERRDHLLGYEKCLYLFSSSPDAERTAA